MSYPYGGHPNRDPYRPGRTRIRPSPVFLGVLALAAVSGFALRQASSDSTGTRLLAFIFVMAVWIITLCLHEFSHAFGAWLAGDQEVESRGYLSLNPLKYAHPVLSIALPVVFIALGGIGLPGGAVYLHAHQFRTRLQRSLVSLAGPMVNVGCAIVLLVLVSKFGTTSSQVYFWVAVSFVAYLQIMAAVLNLLPIPGLDGWGALEPYLSIETRRAAEQIKPYGMLGVFVLLQVGSVNRVFFNAIYWLFERSGISRSAAQVGYTLVKFWTVR